MSNVRPGGFQLVAEQVTSGSAPKDGRWLVYGGDEVLVVVKDISDVDASGELIPFRSVVDLATLKAASQRIIALRDHDRDQPAGSWFDIVIAPERGVVQSLELAVPSNPQSLTYVQELHDLLAAKTPLQASIGAAPSATGYWEIVPAGSSVVVNGRTFTATADVKLGILRNGELYETSVLTFGADSHTGRLAARNHLPTKETPVSTTTNAPTAQQRLKALLAKHPANRHARIAALIAEDADDDAVDQALDDDELSELKAANAKLQADLDAANARCTAAVAEHEATKAQYAADQLKLTAARADGGQSLEATAAAGSRHAAVFSAVPGEGTQPETITQAMKAIALKEPTLKGIQLHKEALRRFPDARRA